MAKKPQTFYHSKTKETGIPPKPEGLGLLPEELMKRFFKAIGSIFSPPNDGLLVQLVSEGYEAGKTAAVAAKKKAKQEIEDIKNALDRPIKVAKIVDIYCVILNVGSEHGIRQGMSFVLKPTCCEEDLKVEDPDTGECLGYIIPPGRLVKVVSINEKCSIAIEKDDPIQPLIKVGDIAEPVYIP